MNTVEVTRRELYDLVWETPTRHLCKKFGLSDVGLAKTCKRLNIPSDLPPLNSTTSRERIWGWSKPREAINATRKEGIG